MIYPPPPGFVFLAYVYGNISKSEYQHWIRLLDEQHKKKVKKDGQEMETFRDGMEA